MGKKGKNLKKPKSKHSNRFKVDDGVERVDYNSSPPIFSLKHIQYGGGCCISNCDSNDRSVILDKLLRLSQLAWKQIASQPKTGNGYESIPQFRFDKPIPNVVTQEVNILVFRYSDAGRIAGFRVNDIYHIIMVGEDLYSH